MAETDRPRGVPKMGIVLAVAGHPSLWWVALRQWARMTPRRWWRSGSHLPIPPDDYLEFRLVTQYGGGESGGRADIEPADVVDYLRWCKAWSDGR